jgi:hypothetical protein
MRWIKDIPHERFKIQILQYNAKYIVKIELGQFEQIYKIAESDVSDLNDIEAMINNSLLSNSLSRFVEMRNDWAKSFAILNEK